MHLNAPLRVMLCMPWSTWRSRAEEDDPGRTDRISQDRGRKGIPMRFLLEGASKPWWNNGVLGTVKGPKGGYRLGGPAAKIPVSEIGSTAVDDFEHIDLRCGNARQTITAFWVPSPIRVHRVHQRLKHLQQEAHGECPSRAIL